MNGIERVIRGIAAAGLHLAAAACLICFAFTCYAVAMRYFANEPQAWVDKVVGWLVVAMVMFAAPAAQLTGEHVAVDTISDRARGRPRRVLAAFALLWVAATAAIMIWEGWAMVAFSRMTGIMTELHPIPIWWIQLLIPIGFLLMLIVVLMQLFRVARGLDSSDPDIADEAAKTAARLKAGPLE